jgi:hypothetical protein
LLCLRFSGGTLFWVEASAAQGTSVHCQIEADGQCHCGPRRGTGRNIPCIPRQEPKQPEPASCPTTGNSSTPEDDRLPYVANQYIPEDPQADLQEYVNKITDYVHDKFVYPPGIHPYNSPYVVQEIDYSRGQLVNRRTRYPYLVRTRLTITVERCYNNKSRQWTYRIQDVTPDMTAAFTLDQRYTNPWVQVPFTNYQQFNDSAIKAAKSLNATQEGRNLLRFPSSYGQSKYTFTVVLKNWDSHNLPQWAGGTG